jgi:serine/threonine protein kinase
MLNPVQIFKKILLKIVRRVQYKKQLQFLNEEFYNLKKNKEKITKPMPGDYTVKISEVDSFKKLKLNESNKETIIGEIDIDGYLLPMLDGVENIPLITKEKFIERKRYSISVISYHGIVAVKKSYGKNKAAFTKEIKALYEASRHGCKVPKILDMDFESLTLTISYIPGRILREELAKKGAVLRNNQVGSNSGGFIQRRKQAKARILEGKKKLPDVVDKTFVRELIAEYDKIHEAGIVDNDIKYGNVIIEEFSGRPYLLDFGGVWYLKNTKSLKFKLFRDNDKLIIKKYFDNMM